MNRWAAVLFDLDGTLCDTIELILRSYRHTMTTHLGAAPPDERFLATLGKPLPVQFLDFARDDAELEAMRETYIAFQRTIHDGLARPYPGTAEVLASLAEQGIRLGVVTSKRSGSAERTLECCGLLDAMEVIVCADHVEHPKPHPEAVRLALQRLGLAAAPREVLFVGDSPYDLRAGRDAGTRTAAALWGPFARGVLEAEAPDHYLDDLPSVLATRP